MKKFILFTLLANWTGKVASFDKAQVEMKPVASSNDAISYTYESFYFEENYYIFQAGRPDDCDVLFPRRSASGQELYDETSNTTMRIQNGLCGAVSINDSVDQPYKNLVWEEVPKLGYSGGVDGTGAFTVDGYYLRLTAKNPDVNSQFIECINKYYYPPINKFNQDRSSCMNAAIIPIMTIVGGGAILFMVAVAAYKHRERIASGWRHCRENSGSIHLSQLPYSLIGGSDSRRRNSNIIHPDDVSPPAAISLDNLNRGVQSLDQIPPPSSPTSPASQL